MYFQQQQEWQNGQRGQGRVRAEPLLEPGILLLALAHVESCCTPAALVLDVLTFKSSRHLYVGLPLNDFPSQHTTAIHQLWLSPHPACSLLPCITLQPSC